MWNRISLQLATDSPLPSELRYEELKCLVSTRLQVESYLMHTEVVESAVKAVTEAAGAVVGAEQTHGLIYLQSAPSPPGDAKGHQQIVLGNAYLKPAICAWFGSRVMVLKHASALDVPNLSRYQLNGVELSVPNVS